MFSIKHKSLTHDKHSLQAQWLKSAMPTLWEAEMGGSLEPRLLPSCCSPCCPDLSWQHGETPSLQKNAKISQGWWHVPVIPVPWEAEAGEFLEPARRRFQWATIIPLHSSLGDTAARFHLKKKKRITQGRGRDWSAPVNQVSGWLLLSDFLVNFLKWGHWKMCFFLRKIKISWLRWRCGCPYDSQNTKPSPRDPLKFMLILGRKLGLKTKQLKRSSCLPGNLLSQAETGRQTRLALSALITPSLKPNACLRRKISFQFKWLRFLS